MGTDPNDKRPGDDNREKRDFFLSNIIQLRNNAVLFEKNDDGSVKCIFASDEFAEMMECSNEEAVALMNRPDFETTFDEDRPAVHSFIQKRSKDDGKSTITVRKITARGNIIWCSIHCAFIDDFGTGYIYCTYNDVTAFKEYEDRMRNSYTELGDRFYREDESTLGMFQVNLTKDYCEDIRGKDLFASDCDMYTYSEIVRLRAGNFPILTEQEAFLNTFGPGNLLELYKNGTSKVSMFLFSKRSDGTVCYVNYTAVLTTHPTSGNTIAFITEKECNRDKVNETLTNKILAKQFDMVAYIANGKYGVVIGDASNIERGGIFPHSKSGEYDKYISSQVKPVLHGTEEEKKKILRMLSRCAIVENVKKKEPYVVNIVCDIGDETYHKRFDFYSIDKETKFYVLLKSDTTELHRIQDERNAKLKEALDEAQAASVAKTAFLSRMSHEIRTPMNAIIGLDNIALKEKGISSEMRGNLSKIGQSAKYLLSLINDILDMSRIESGRMSLKNEEFSFMALIAQINTVIEEQCRDRGLSYEYRLNGKFDDVYIGDDIKLKQVLINILGNSVKFTEPGGKVTFIVESPRRLLNQCNIRFMIKDTGVGIDREFIPRIFEAFSQEDGTNTSVYGGSGLGMAITKNIVSLMNGDISVESEKGKGSCFTVDVVLKVPDEGTVRKELDIDPHEMKILIVDDDPVALKHAKIELDELGISAETAESGAEGIEMVRLCHARREAYTFIVLDLKMPELDGIEVCKRMRQIVGDESSIVMATAYNWADVEEMAEDAGIDSFVSKPLFASGVLYEFKQIIKKKHRALEDDAPIDLSGRKILLAEDVEINAEIMEQLLEMKGMVTEHAENGELCLKMFEESPIDYYDAILMDVRMPVMDGLSATAAIRALDRPDAGTVPIIAMTANAFDEDVQRSLNAGMNAHLSKPVEPDNLYDALSGFIKERMTIKIF